MSDSLLGAIIAGGCGVVIVIISNVIRAIWEMWQSHHNLVIQRQSEYVNKRIQAYEGFLAYCNAYISFVKFVHKEWPTSSALEFVDKTSIWRDVFKPQEKYLVAVRLYGEPQIYARISRIFEGVGFERELIGSDWSSNIECIERKLKEIAIEMREEVAKLMNAEQHIGLLRTSQIRTWRTCFMQRVIQSLKRVKVWFTLTNFGGLIRLFQCWGVFILNIILAFSCYCMKGGFAYDIILALTTGLWIYWITIEFWTWRRFQRLKGLLHKKHCLFKSEIIRMFLTAVKKPQDQENINMLLSPQAFEEFFLKKEESRTEKQNYYVVMNYLIENPERLSDLRVEIKLFFESVLSLLMVNNVRLEVLDEFVDFSERYKRLEHNSDLNQDVKYVVESLFYWFADRTAIHWERGATFEHLINKI